MNRICVFLLSLSVLCGKPGKQPGLDPFFLEDIAPSESQSFKGVESVITEGLHHGMTEEEIQDRFGGPPTRRWTFRKPMVKGMGGTQFSYDRIICYSEVKTVNDSLVDSRKSVITTGMLERLTVTFFLLRGRSQYHVVDHWVRASARAEWTKGKFYLNPGATVDENWSGSLRDGIAYWMQRVDRQKYVGNIDKIAKEYGITAENGYLVVPAK